jgi:alpha-L-rhamnosidase
VKFAILLQVITSPLKNKLPGHIKNTGMYIARINFIIIMALCVFVFNRCLDQNRHSATGLMTDLLLTPGMAVITNPEPRFTWIIEDDRQGARQTAWQIMVASSADKARRGNGDMWNSGKKISSLSVSIPYGGEPLEPFATYWWKVRTWDQDERPGKWSDIQQVPYRGI